MLVALTQAKTQNKAFFATVKHLFITLCIHSDFAFLISSPASRISKVEKSSSNQATALQMFLNSSPC